MAMWIIAAGALSVVALAVLFGALRRPAAGTGNRAAQEPVQDLVLSSDS